VTGFEHGALLHLAERRGRVLRDEWLGGSAAESLAGQFKALGEPTRLGLALALRRAGELCVCDLSWIAQRPQNLTSHHMQILKVHGIVTGRKEGKMTMYELTAQGAALLDAVVGQQGTQA